MSRTATPMTAPVVPLPAASDPVWSLGLRRVRLLHEYLDDLVRGDRRRRSAVYG